MFEGARSAAVAPALCAVASRPKGPNRVLVAGFAPRGVVVRPQFTPPAAKQVGYRPPCLPANNVAGFAPRGIIVRGEPQVASAAAKRGKVFSVGATSTSGAAILLRRGPSNHIPTARLGEPLWTTDQSRLYVGTGAGNVHIGGGKDFVNLMDAKYGIVANDSGDYSSGLQSWANDICSGNCIGIVPGNLAGMIRFGSTVTFAPQSGGNPITITILGGGHVEGGGAGNVQFDYTGNYSQAFLFQGITSSLIQGIGINVGGTQTGVVCFDVQPTQAINNCPFNKFSLCNVSIGSVSGTACVAFRLGQQVSSPLASSTAASACNNTTFDQCHISSQSGNGAIAFQLGAQEGFMALVNNCWGSHCDIFALDGNVACQVSTGGGTLSAGATTIPVATLMGSQIAATQFFPSAGYIQIDSEIIQYSGLTATSFTGCTRGAQGTGPGVTHNNFSFCNLWTPGQGVYIGTGHMTALGCGNSAGLCDYMLIGPTTTAVYRIMNGRYEAGNRFVQYGYGGATGARAKIDVEQCTINTYVPPIDHFGIVQLQSPATFRIHGSVTYNSLNQLSSPTNPFITNRGAATGSPGVVSVERCDIYGIMPIDNNANGWQWRYRDNRLLIANASFSSWLSDDSQEVATVTSAYTVTMADGLILANAAGGAFAVTLMSAATVPRGRRWTIKKTDATGSAVTVTPNGTDTIDAAATYALSAQNKYVTVVCDGVSNWDVVANN